jgi:hypothetical protein
VPKSKKEDLQVREESRKRKRDEGKTADRFTRRVDPVELAAMVQATSELRSWASTGRWQDCFLRLDE